MVVKWVYNLQVIIYFDTMNFRFGDLDNDIENDEKKEESDDDGYVTEEITEKKHDEL